MLHWATSPKDVTSLLPPLGFFTRNEVFRYSTWTLTCSGFAKTPAASSSSNLACNSSRVFLLYCGSRLLHWGGRVGPMLTTASISQFLCRPRRIPQLWQQWFQTPLFLTFSAFLFMYVLQGTHYNNRSFETTEGCNFFILTFGIDWYMTLLPNLVGRTAKTSSFKQTILRMHSFCSSFNNLWMKSSRDEVGAAKNSLFASPSAAAIILKLHRKSNMQSCNQLERGSKNLLFFDQSEGKKQNLAFEHVIRQVNVSCPPSRIPEMRCREGGRKVMIAGYSAASWSPNTVHHAQRARLVPFFVVSLRKLQRKVRSLRNSRKHVGIGFGKTVIWHSKQ